MLPDINNWQSVSPDCIQNLLGEFDRWCLCGGRSLDMVFDRETREHGDTDIGVFRSDLEDCLSSIGRQRVFLCDPPGSHKAWDGKPVPEHVDDIWIIDTDRLHWILQIMVYTDEGNEVCFKRNPGIRWRKESHTWNLGTLHILNPLVTLLYKSSKQTQEPKDIQDIGHIIDFFRR